MRHLAIVFAAALLVAGPRCARATVLLAGDLGDIARGASAIVRGTVVGQATQWVDGRRRVETIVTFDVAESLKGGFSGRISFQVPGGVLGRYRSLMIGAPTFTTGEEVIVCLGAKAPALPYVLGLGQGVFRIQRAAGSTQAMVTTPVLLSTGTTTTVTRGDPSRRSMTLDDFRTALRVALAGDAASRRVPDGRDTRRHQ